MRDHPFRYFWGFICLCIICFSVIYIAYKYNIPKKGTLLRYEIYKECKVPIKADGKGGEYGWIGDVPWAKFTIEEKFDMARVHGGWLSADDIKEIQQKYGAR